MLYILAVSHKINPNIKREKRRVYERNLRLGSFPTQSQAKHTFWAELMKKEIDSEIRKKSQQRMNLSRLESQLQDPVEVDLTKNTKRLFPDEQNRALVKPLMNYYIASK